MHRENLPTHRVGLPTTPDTAGRPADHSQHCGRACRLLPTLLESLATPDTAEGTTDHSQHCGRAC